MKNILLFLSFFLLISCKSFNDFRQQKATLISTKSQKFTIQNNACILSLKVNNVEGLFLFDTGAMTSVISNPNFIKKFNLTKDNYYTSYKVKGATGVSVEKSAFVSDSISSEIIKGEKNIFSHMQIEGMKRNCTKDTLDYDGIIGFDIFKLAGQPILLDFENNTISVLPTEYKTTGFIKINGKVATGLDRKITIPLKIDGVETSFTLDTGNNSGIVIPSKKDFLSADKLVTTIEMLIGTANRTEKNKMKYYENVSVKNENGINETVFVSSLPNLIDNLIGMGFIKHYNWILDFNSGAIYIKKISDFETIDYKKNILVNFKLKCFSLNNKLLVGAKNLSINSPYDVGDEIISIGDKKITSQNICEIEDLINKTEDWSLLNLATVSPKN